MIKNTLRRIMVVLLAVLMVISTAACSSETVEAPSSKLSMYVGLGNSGSGYYPKLKEAIYENLGIEIDLVYSNTNDGSNAVVDMIKNNDLPADIVVTASRTADEYQKTAFLDLAAYTNVPELFTTSKIYETAIDGAVYQLPYTTRLIGVEYNKTLFDEQGWELPETFDDMVALKTKAEEAGYPFAVSGAFRSGHGFNYLFHLMGSEFVSSPDGREWFDNFKKGESDVSLFAEKSEYFKEYAEAGLFGFMHDTDWNAKNDFMQERALFYYNIINDTTSYDGFRMNHDGTIYGAEYGKDGLPVAIEDESGEAVLTDGKYVLYNSDDETHQGKQRYTIPGSQVLHDSYGSMPWLSRNAGANFFTSYDNMFLALDKKLADKGNEQKLADAIKVLEFMTTKPATDLFTSMVSDGYVATNDFEIDDSRLYSEYADQIKKGYLQPWYYNYFGPQTIETVGTEVNYYIEGINGATFDSVMKKLDQENTNEVNNTVEIAGKAEKTFSYKENAQFQAIANALSLQSVLKENGIDKTLSVSLMPYLGKMGDIPTETSIGVTQTKIYEGDIEKVTLSMYVNQHSGAPVAIIMTGSEINNIVMNGFNTLTDYGLDKTFSYTMVVKNGNEVKRDKEYLVCVSPKSLDSKTYERFLISGKVLRDSDGKPYAGNMIDGITEYLSKYPTISPSTLKWTDD